MENYVQNCIKRGDIFKAKIETVKAVHVQNNTRPVVIIQNDVGNEFSPTLIVCPITSAHKNNVPTHVYLNDLPFLRKKSTILCEQILTIDKSSLIEYMGSLDKERIKWLDSKLKKSLQLT